MDKTSKSCGFMKQISTLEDKVSGLTAKIVHLEECDSFLIGIDKGIDNGEKDIRRFRKHHYSHREGVLSTKVE
jgi:hypothetical protein